MTNQNESKNEIGVVQQKIDWNLFEKPGKKFFKPETGKEHVISFSRYLGQEIREIKDKQTGEIKKIPALLLETDEIDGEKLKIRWEITSVRLIKTIREYEMKGLLFSKVFILKKSGEGTQTTYQFYPIRDKEQPAKSGSPNPAPSINDIIDKKSLVKIKIIKWDEPETELYCDDGKLRKFKLGAEMEVPYETARILIEKGYAKYI